MPNEEADREFVKEASALAFDVAERGLSAVVDYMKTSFRVTAPTDAKRSDIERAMILAADGVDGARGAVASTRSEEQTKLEKATVDFVRAVTPRVIGAAARIVTGKNSLPDEPPRDNAVRIVQEVGRIVTSLLNDSVGAAPMRGPVVPGAPGPEIIRLELDEGAKYLSFQLENIGLMAVDPVADHIELRTTPLIGESHVIAETIIKPPDVIHVQRSAVINMYVDPNTPPGTYRGYVYALWKEEPALSKEKPVALGALELRVPDRPEKPEVPEVSEVPLTTVPTQSGSE